MTGILLMAVGNSYGSAPVNTVAPAVTGTATVGQTLSTTDGTWTGAPAPTFTYQWQRTGANIGGATSSTYVLVAADYANTIRCVVTATNSVAPSGVSANSNSTASVAGNAPVNTVAPAVTGTPTVGQTLSTTDGTWTGVPTPSFTYQWQRTGSNIGGATSSTYVLVAADYANTIRCVVTATNAVAAVSANSNSTASVAGNAPVNTVAPAVTGTATVRQTLTTTDGTWTGVPTPTFTYQWQRAGSNIGGATSSTYVLVDADAGNAVRCVVTGTNAVAAVAANSNATAAVATTVPGAPTIGSASATGSTTATVAYTAPASNGGATITNYTATSSPSGITGTLNQAGSGTITVTGLTGSTAYTFTVTATNSVGTSAASAASNSTTTLPAIGAAYEGGYFAGQISTAANGVADFNLVVGPLSTAQSSLQWKTTKSDTPGTSSDIDGPANSAAMNNASHPAAQFCEGLTIGGYSDWYMPAKLELEICYFNLKPTTQNNNPNFGTNIYAVPTRNSNYPGGNTNPSQTSAAAFQSGGAEAFGGFYYWASTQYSANYGWMIYFKVGDQVAGNKNDPTQVRAVRRVSV